MTRLVVLCDGTWNNPTQKEPTHVDELAKATAGYGQPDPDQQAVYFDGVGNTEDFGGPIRQALTKYGGGAFGWGLSGKILEAYAWLAERYKPGDEIFLFGFSRGAYTARSLAGLIRKAGFPDHVTPQSLDDAFDLYKRSGPENAPDKDHIMRARRALSPHFATSAKEQDWRGDDTPRINIAYLGVWDTVGAMGVPGAYVGGLARILNYRHAFHDTNLSSEIGSARHAVSLDEQRRHFPPTLWANLDSLAREKGETGSGIREDRPYQEMWFVGDHGAVGGSGANCREISAVALEWIAKGARLAGMTFDSAINLPSCTPDSVLGDSVMAREGQSFLDWLILRPRKGPKRRFEVHPSVRLRLAANPGYRPESLSPDLY